VDPACLIVTAARLRVDRAFARAPGHEHGLWNERVHELYVRVQIVPLHPIPQLNRARCEVRVCQRRARRGGESALCELPAHGDEHVMREREIYATRPTPGYHVQLNVRT